MKTPFLDAESRALIQTGFFSKIDLLFALFMLTLIGASLFIWLFGHPVWTTYVIILLLAILDIALWALVIAYRGMYFTLTLKAEIILLPEQAGRLAVQMLSQGQAPQDG